MSDSVVLNDKEFKRYWSKVQISNDSCWVWNGTRLSFGHGHFWFRGKLILTHRLSWLIHRGPIPDGLCICHKCDNPPCVNPDHLFIGTKGDNTRDMEMKGRSNHPSGDANGARTKPETRARGENNGSVIHPESRPRGIENTSTKLTEEMVIEIRALYSSGFTNKCALGRRFGVTEANIRSIVTRVTWRHVP